MLKRLPRIGRLISTKRNVAAINTNVFPPHSGSPIIVEAPETKLTTLVNGFRVASYNNQLPTATVGVWIDAGSRYETDKNNGVAHFLEHMAFKGTTKRSQMDLELEVENLGAHLNAYTSRENTVYYAKCFDYDLERAVEILSDILLNSVYGKTEVERERSVILREMEEVNRNLQELVFDELHAGAFAKTPLSYTILGPEKTSRPRMLLAAAGGVEHDRLVALAQKYFGHIGRGSEHVLDYEKGVFHESHQLVHNAEMQTVFGALAVEGTSWTHEDNLPLQIAHTLVGQYDRTMATGLSAPTRLASAMVEVPEVESFMSFATNYKDTGLSGIYFITQPSAAGQFAEMICKEWQYLAHVKVSEEELQRAKKSLYSSMMLTLDGTTPICEDIGRQIMCYGRRLTPPELEARISAITPESVRDVCNKYYIDEKFAYTVIGPTTFWPDAAVIKNWLKAPSSEE